MKGRGVNKRVNKRIWTLDCTAIIFSTCSHDFYMWILRTKFYQEKGFSTPFMELSQVSHNSTETVFYIRGFFPIYAYTCTCDIPRAFYNMCNCQQIYLKQSKNDNSSMLLTGDPTLYFYDKRGGGYLSFVFIYSYKICYKML